MEKYFKKSVQTLQGYTSPPQKEYRIKLNQNESPFDVPATIKAELSHLAVTSAWHRYPVNESPQLKAKLAEWHGVDPDAILLGNGSNQLLQTMLTACVDNGDRVLYCPPTFSLFDLFSIIYNGCPVEVLRAPGRKFPLEQVLEKMALHEPSILLLCSPNNPTGAEIEYADIRHVCEAASGLVLIDEAYAEFSGKTVLPMLKEFPHLII
jgi:histidinol-phosphate aminotransferase